MDSAITYPGIAIAAAIVLVVFLFIARRLLRLVVRLMFVGVLVIALLAAGAWGWWNGWIVWPATPPTEHAAPTRRTPAH